MPLYPRKCLVTHGCGLLLMKTDYFHHKGSLCCQKATAADNAR